MRKSAIIFSRYLRFMDEIGENMEKYMEKEKAPHFHKDELHIFDTLPTGVLILTDNGQNSLEYAYSNPFLAQSLDYTHEEFAAVLKENCFAAIYDADRDRTRSAREDVIAGKVVESTSRQKKKDGSFVWVLAHLRQVFIDGRAGILFLFSQIHELIGLQDELLAKNETWSDILQSVPIGLMVFKIENGITTTLSVNKTLLGVANRAGSQIDSNHRNWTEAEFGMIINQNVFAFSEEDDIPALQNMMEESHSIPVSHCIFKLRGTANKKVIYMYTTCASKKTGENGRIYYVTFQNVTDSENRRMELIEKQIQLYEMSYTDALTGVKNRNAYNEFANNCRDNRIYNVGFAFLDINGLKQTNDTLGHYYGDQMILRLTTILKDYFSPEYIYRLSGDEFIVICPNIERSDFQKVMGGLIEKIQSEEDLASIGFIWKNNVSDIQRRTTQAEQIMYVEKQKYYEKHRAISSKHRPQFLESLLKDFEEGRFVMYLQPKTMMDDSRVMGAEALVRKFTADGKMIAPYEFVPQLEYEKLIPKLDFYMLEQTCIFLEEQHKLGRDDFSVSVNISRVTIAENEFLRTVMSILDKYDFERKNLEFELTESNKTLDSIRLEEYIYQIKALGIKISLDDMGTDYSTLTMLILDGIDWVKLDRSIIIRIGQEKTKVLLKHVIKMCHDMNLRVIAEGVEKEEDRLLLLDMGCDAYQGYLKSKPIPVKEFQERFL